MQRLPALALCCLFNLTPAFGAPPLPQQSENAGHLSERVALLEKRLEQLESQPDTSWLAELLSVLAAGLIGWFASSMERRCKPSWATSTWITASPT